MPIIGCTREDNCKRDAFLKKLAERAAGLPLIADDSSFREIANRKENFIALHTGFPEERVKREI